MNTNQIVKDVSVVIRKNFDEITINNESYVHSEKIKAAISAFTNGNFDWIDRGIFRELRADLIDYEFDNQSHLFLNDRCLRIFADKSVNNYTHSYTISVSIFGYFSIHHTNYFTDVDNKRQFEPTEFIEQGKKEFCDSVFQIVRKYFPKLIWLPNETGIAIKLVQN